MACTRHDIEEEYVFQFRGQRYECIGENRDFDIEQYKILLEWKEYTTIANRIVNQVMWNPIIRKI